MSPLDEGTSGQDTGGGTDPGLMPTLTVAQTLPVDLAAAQPTALGREIHRLHIHDGRLFVSYGDYGANTGPIHVLSLDLTDLGAGFTDEITLNTEETWQMRTLTDGRLAVPYCDPIGTEDPAQGALALRAVDGTWRVVTTVTDHPPIHAFGALTTAGRLWLFGASGADINTAAAWWSDDDGATWTWEPIATGTVDFNRTCASAEIGGELYAWVYNPFDTSTTGRYHRTGGAWVRESPDGAEDALVSTLSGQPVVWTYNGGIQSGEAQAAYPVVWGPSSPAQPDGAGEHTWNLTVGTDGNVYGLLTDGTIRKWVDGTPTDLGVIDTALGARSIAADIDNSVIYLGTTDSNVLTVDL